MRMIDMETSVDVSCTCSPYRSTAGCAVCEKFDELRCSRGRHCLSATHVAWRDGKPIGPEEGRVIGVWLEEDYYTGRASSGSSCVFSFPSAPDLMFCEDCVCEIEQGDAEVVIDGEVDGVYWCIETSGGEFHARLATHDRTGGVSWEEHCGQFDRLGVAREAALAHMRQGIDR